MPAKVIKFRHKETKLVWDVDQPAQIEQMDASKDFERVADAPAPPPAQSPADKAAADKAAADKAAADKAAADKAAADKAAADKAAADKAAEEAAKAGNG